MRDMSSRPPVGSITSWLDWAEAEAERRWCRCAWLGEAVSTIYCIYYIYYLLSTVSIIYSVSILSTVTSPELHAGPAPGLPDPGEEDEGELALGHPNLDT